MATNTMVHLYGNDSEDLDSSLILKDANDDDDNDYGFDKNLCGTQYVDMSKLKSFSSTCMKNSINIMHINCRSILKNIDGIQNLLHVMDNRLLALAVTETWLTPVNQDTVSMPGYNFISQQRIGKSGGGIGIFVNCDFDHHTRNDLCKNEPHIEALFVELPQGST